MMHGYHLIWPAYGFWLPNDPRGSWSDTVYSLELLRFGPAIKSIEKIPVDLDEYARWRTQAQRALKYPAVTFSELQIANIGMGFQSYVEKSGLSVWACAIMPNHVHMVLGRHRYKIEHAANLLKGAATKRLLAESLHPMESYREKEGRLPSMWGEGQWIVYLDSEESIINAIRYVNENPTREGRPFQNWSFVTPFDGLPVSGWTTYY